MATRGLVGKRDSDGTWRGVGVHWNAQPEELGASLVGAVRDHGLDAVLAHVFSAPYWSSWPAEPHHPDGDGEHVSSPPWGVEWLYLFRPDGTLEVHEGSTDHAPAHVVDAAALREGRAAFARAEAVPLPPPLHAWVRSTGALGPVLGKLLDALGLRSDVGVGTEPWSESTRAQVRRLDLEGRSVAIEAMGSSARNTFFHVGGEPVPFPDCGEWLATRPELVAELGHALGMELEAVPGSGLVRWRNVVARVTDPVREVSLADAHPVGQFVVGDSHGVVVTDGTRFWRWVFDEAWRRAA